MASESNVPVVHFYPASPYAFKLLLALGLKGIAFDSHLVAPIPPRKATQTLANGHRRIPVLQLGNELFCDTASALAALEARFKESPSLTPSLAGTLTATAYAAWADKIVFPATAALLPWEHLPAAFRADRAIMSARDPSTFVAASQRARPHMRAQLLAALSHLNAHLQQSPTGWVAHEPRPTFCDVHAAMGVFFLQTPALAKTEGALLARFPHIQAWYTRIVSAAGGADRLFRGQRSLTELEVLQRAREGCRSHGDVLVRELQSQSQSGDGVERIRMGDFVAVSPDDYGKVQITGRLLYLSETQVVIQHQVHEGDEFWTALYFPRSGYVVSKRDSASKL